MNGLLTYFKESYNELMHHVTWPTWAEAQRLTVIVATFSVIFALAIWGVDTLFSRLISFYFDLVKN